MKNILIYKSEDNLHVTHFVDSLDVEAVQLQAEKQLPHGTLYRVGTTDELPADRTFRDAWDLDQTMYTNITPEHKLQQDKQTLEQQLLKHKQHAVDVTDTQQQIDESETLLQQLSADAIQADTRWLEHKTQAFQAKSTWESHLSAAEAAELTVTQAGSAATDAQREQATTLRATADAAWDTQDELFQIKREAQQANTLYQDATTTHDELLVQLDQAKRTQASIQASTQAINVIQQQLDELLVLLPLSARASTPTI
jgi:chromosome segregation ATPase